MKGRRKPKSVALTLPDLVLLSLLAERPMHGYEANAELERRQVRDWAAISRAQIYYSLEKLQRSGLLKLSPAKGDPAGPEKHSFQPTHEGRTQLALALARDEWALARERPPFLTWLALSWQADEQVAREQFARRKAFLLSEIAREEETLSGALSEVGHSHHEAIWMLQLTLDHRRLELTWIERVTRELNRRAPARGK